MSAELTPRDKLERLYAERGYFIMQSSFPKKVGGQDMSRVIMDAAEKVPTRVIAISNEAEHREQAELCGVGSFWSRNDGRYFYRCEVMD